MNQTTSSRLTLGQRWYRLRTSPRFPYLLLLGLLMAGALSQVYYYWWDVRIEQMLGRNNGSVEKASVYPHWMKKHFGHKFVSRFEPIQSASLHFNPPDSHAGLPNDLRLFRGALFLRELRVYGKLSDHDIRQLKCLTQLRSVLCWYRPELAIEGVAELPNLTSLSLYFEDAPEPTVLQRVAEMSQLERLSIYLGSRGRGPRTIAGMKELAKSQTLYRLDTQLYKDEFLALTSLLPDGSSPLPFLAELRIPNSRDIPRQSMGNLTNLPNLIHLDLSNWLITDAHLKPLQQLPYLRTLYLEDNPGITDAGVDVLAAMHNLQSLNVKGTKISVDGLFQLATLPRLRCLRAHPRTHEVQVELRKRLPAGCELDTN